MDHYLDWFSVSPFYASVISNNVIMLYINNLRIGIYHKYSMEKKYLCQNQPHRLPVTSHLSQV